VSQHSITPVETGGGTKMVVIRTGLTTAYVVEFRTKLGIQALDNRGRYQGALLYRIDTAQWQNYLTTDCVCLCHDAILPLRRRIQVSQQLGHRLRDRLASSFFNKAPFARWIDLEEYVACRRAAEIDRAVN